MPYVEAIITGVVTLFVGSGGAFALMRGAQRAKEKRDAALLKALLEQLTHERDRANRTDAELSRVQELRIAEGARLARALDDSLSANKYVTERLLQAADTQRRSRR